MSYFPFFMNIEQKKFCVFGGGQIAARRIQGLLRYGAIVTVAAPFLHEEILKLHQSYQQQLHIEQRAYCLGEIQNENADYVLDATNDADVNAYIYRECRHKEIPVNNASDHRQCDFYFPALIEKDDLVIGVTSIDGNHKKVAEFSKTLRNVTI